MVAGQTWTKGLQDEKKDSGFHQFKLRGQPWVTYDHGQVVNGREVMCRLLEVLDGAGYDLVGSVDMTIGNDSRDGESFLARHADAFRPN